jgi:hypothetical protein
MQLLPVLVVSILEFCAVMDPALALLIMIRTGALHFRNACAHILYRLVITSEHYWCGIRFPCLLSDGWVSVQNRRMLDQDRIAIVDCVIRGGLTVPGVSCPLWCYKEPRNRGESSRVEGNRLFVSSSSLSVARSDMASYGQVSVVPYRLCLMKSGRVLQKKTWDKKTELAVYVHDWNKGGANLDEWARVAGIGGSLWQKAAVYGGPRWLQPVVDVPFRIRPGRSTRRPHPEALKELIEAGFRPPKHYITWAPQVAPDLFSMLYPIFGMLPGAYIGGSYPLFLMLGGPPDLNGPCSMGWTAGGIDLYLVGRWRPGLHSKWGASVQICGREAYKPAFLRGVVLYVNYQDSPPYSRLDFEVCDIAIVLVGRVITMGCSERSVLSLLTGVIRGWADVPIDAERAEKYAARGYEMRLGAGGSAGIRHVGFPRYLVDR